MIKMLSMQVRISVLLFVCFCASAEELKPLSDVPEIDEKKLAPAYWLGKLHNSGEVLLSPSQIEQFNQALVNSNPYVSNPLLVAEQLSKEQLLKMTQKIRSLPKSDRFYTNGTKLSKQDYEVYQANIDIDQVSAKNKVRFGLVVKRAPLRKFPTFDRVVNSEMDTDLDRFQESALFPGSAVAILLTSKDKKWKLVQAYNYLAWIPAKYVAVGSKEVIKEYLSPESFLLITGSKVQTNYVPDLPQISELQLDMGVTLPLVPKEDIPTQLYGQNPFASYMVYLPTRTDAGKLKLVKALIARNNDVHLGYLSFTAENLVNQAFKFLGERYGWGHDYNARDCTGFVGEIYKSFGLLMPRNSGDQGKTNYGLDHRFNKKADEQQKLTAISNLKVGDLIYIPGHVMMYLGEDEGKPYVIHDVKSLAYIDENGELYRGTLNGVSVTPLLPLRASETNSYLDLMYNIKRIK